MNGIMRANDMNSDLTLIKNGYLENIWRKLGLKFYLVVNIGIIVTRYKNTGHKHLETQMYVFEEVELQQMGLTSKNNI